MIYSKCHLGGTMARWIAPSASPRAIQEQIIAGWLIRGGHSKKIFQSDADNQKKTSFGDDLGD